MSPAQLGIGFTNRLPAERYLTNQILLNGSGVALGDVDGDGWCDVFFCGIDQPSALYRNLGNWRFEDITARAGVACVGQPSTGAALVDLDGDGDLDLLVNGLGTGTRLFRNEGAGRFSETTLQAGFGKASGAHSLALADIDGDDDLDLYVVNYRTTTFRDEPNKRFRVATANQKFELVAVDGRQVTAPDLIGRFSVDPVTGVMENGEADVLYLNDGQGHFVEAGWGGDRFLDEDGRPLAIPYDWGLSAMFHDWNGDGAPELYVCNDFQSPDRLWVNDGRGHFRAIARRAVRQTSIFSMGVDVADVDRDGRDDILVADMLSREHAKRQVQLMERQPFVLPAGEVDNRPQYSRNTLLWNRGDGSFAEIAQFSGLEASEWTWCPVFLDVDLDGYEDALMVTGHVRDAQNIDVARRIDSLTKARELSWLENLRLRGLFTRLEVPNLAFRNRCDLTFAEVGTAWGFNSRKVSQGIALADLDNDGDLDVVANCLDDGPLVCRNESSRPRVAVRLRGLPPNTRGIGARIEVAQSGWPTQSQEIIAGGRYLSSDDAARTFAAADPASEVTLTIRWRSGRQSTIPRARANRVYEVDESAAERPAPPIPTAPPPPLFADVSDRMAHRHVDAPYDDFQQQPLLPHKLSQLGPGVSWFDVDGDGIDDLIVGSGRGGQIGVYRSDGQGGFAPFRQPSFIASLARDQTTVLGWQPNADRRVLLAGSANYEDGLTNGPVLRQYDLADGTVTDGFPGQPASTGPLALADIDGDGDLDLFVGGRVLPGRYPEPASSLLFRNDAGRLRLEPDWCQALVRVGLVSGAVFSDLDADGFPDLILACECGPLRLFRNQRGRWVAWDAPLSWKVGTQPSNAPTTVSGLTGWWNSVGAGDFDGDGRMDLIAGNWGRNTKYQSHLAAPLHNYHADLNDDGFVELVEAYQAAELGRVVPLRDWETLSLAMPFIRERFDSFTAFSTAGVREALGEQWSRMQDEPVRTLESLLLLNRGDHFEVVPLPVEAQWSPVFGIAVADFNGDGAEDAFLAQNFFAVAPLTSRLDAGLGVLLEGDGTGEFHAVPAERSGLRIEGEGRGAAACDFDQDGRVDLAVGQNAQATRLFRNARAKPGLRVRLRGVPGNPSGVGARLRPVDADGRFGAAKEIHSGGGYWSQDSPVTVVGGSGQPRAIEVVWPGGLPQRVLVPPGARLVELTPGEKSRPAP